MKDKKKVGRPRSKQKYDAWLAIPMNKEFYNKFRIVAQAEGVSAAELGRRILQDWMIQKSDEILKKAGQENIIGRVARTSVSQSK